MGEPKFTPGPWSAEEPMEGWLIRADDPNRPGKRFLICDIGPSYRSRADEIQAHANAHLIAAAPALFEACAAFVKAEDELLAELRAAGQLPDVTERPWTLVDDMRAALSQALGEPTQPPSNRSEA